MNRESWQLLREFLVARGWTVKEEGGQELVVSPTEAMALARADVGPERRAKTMDSLRRHATSSERHLESGSIPAEYATQVEDFRVALAALASLAE